MATIQEKQLGQLRPANTTAASLYSPAAGITTIVKNITICNTSGDNAEFRLFLDDDGTTYDETTAVSWDVLVEPNKTIVLNVYWPMDDENGNLAVRTDTASALTFTAFGAEITA